LAKQEALHHVQADPTT